MRCRACNVDLPDNYTACPLCGEKTSPDEVKISGIRYSECPKVKTEKYKPNPFPIFLGIWAAVGLVMYFLQKSGILSPLLAASVFSGTAALWTLVGRPLLVKQLYVGNFIIMNFWPLVLGVYLFAKQSSPEIAGSLFANILPAGCAVLAAALFVVILAVPRHAKRAAPYAVLLGLTAAFASIASVIKNGLVFQLWPAVMVLCACLLLYLFARDAQATKEELKAKFSIQ